MKQKLFLSLLSILFIAVLFSACKKNADSKDNSNSDAQVAVQADDQAQVSSELDDIAFDANTVAEYDPVFSGNNSTLDQLVCDATVEFNKDSDPMTITITYNGSNCGRGRTRTGKVVLSMPKGQQWKTVGSEFSVTFDNLVITRGRDNKSITINGTQTHTNVSGGLLVNLATDGPITHSINSGDMSVSFNNGAARTWNVARQHVFTYNNGIVLTISGAHTEGDVSGIAEWGSNRLGNEFTTIITSPLVIKQDCNFRVTGGEVKHITAAQTSIITFGLDVTGLATTCPGTGSFFYKLAWSGANGNSLNLILPY